MITRWPAQNEMLSPEETACFDCIVVDKLMREAWMGSVDRRNLLDSITWDKGKCRMLNTVARLIEIIKSGDGVELERSRDGLLLAVTSELPVGKLVLIKNVPLGMSNEIAISKLIQWSLQQSAGKRFDERPPGKVKASGEIPRHASSGVDPKLFDEHEVKKLCTEVEQVLGKLRGKNTVLRQECIDAFGHEMYLRLLNEVPLPEVADDEVRAELESLTPTS
ncbi:hypothetical protein FOZ61_009944 [Perkinsus olseni]|uniref:Uncharacterized protein n=1 Tax=Perkinsus olseni TaxID=32597 RepID=A0A7J6KYU0_PEROL|nr:hypothetical protein FOZ61_009944 [Perkinsus olseni]KAF4653872.1 hypothetical protein FOL46_008986 [Perkinsus olseni]